MMVHDRHRRGIPELQTFPASGVVRAIDKNSHPIIGQREDVVRAEKRHPCGEKLQAAWDGVGVDAHDVEAQGREYPGQRHLRADTITIWPSVTHNRNAPTRERGQ
jgi:hypothetical protein